MGKNHFRAALFALLGALVCGAGALALGAAAPDADAAARGAVCAGTFFSSPQLALAAMARVWQEQHGAAAAPAGQGGGEGGFWMDLPAAPAAAAAVAAPAAAAGAPAAALRPAGTLPVAESTFTAAAGPRLLACGAGFVKNATRLPAAEVAAEFGRPPAFTVELGSGAPQVLIMHTHATECYRAADGLWYDPSENGRTTDDSRNMVAVGKELADALNAAGINTVQDVTQHDYPSYTGSYERSRATVEQWLARCPSIKVVLDIHRDAIERDGGVRVAPVALENGVKAAQLMIICGADDGSGRLTHDRLNLRFAAALQAELAARYPDLARPVLFDYRSYNQQLTTGSLLIEIGGHGNTLAEAKATARLLAAALAKTLGA